MHYIYDVPAASQETKTCSNNFVVCAEVVHIQAVILDQS